MQLIVLMIIGELKALIHGITYTCVTRQHHLMYLWWKRSIIVVNDADFKIVSFIQLCPYKTPQINTLSRVQKRTLIYTVF